MAKRDFTDLKQVIGEGGAKSVAVQLSHGKTEIESGNWLRNHYSGITEQVIEQTIGIARRGMRAASKIITALGPVDTERLDELRQTYGPGAGDEYSVIKYTGRNETGQFERVVETVHSPDIEFSAAEIVPELFGDTPDGRRGELTAELILPPNNSPIRFDFELTGEESIDDLLVEAAELFRKIITTDPTRFDNMGIREATDFVFRSIFFARRF